MGQGLLGKKVRVRSVVHFHSPSVLGLSETPTVTGLSMSSSGAAEPSNWTSMLWGAGVGSERRRRGGGVGALVVAASCTTSGGGGRWVAQ